MLWWYSMLEAKQIAMTEWQSRPTKWTLISLNFCTKNTLHFDAVFLPCFSWFFLKYAVFFALFCRDFLLSLTILLNRVFFKHVTLHMACSNMPMLRLSIILCQIWRSYNLWRILFYLHHSIIDVHKSFPGDVFLATVEAIVIWSFTILYIPNKFSFS